MPNDYTPPEMEFEDTVIVFTYADSEYLDFYDYSIGQGNLVSYETDPETLTITMRRSAQDDADKLEEFDNSWASGDAGDVDLEAGIVSYSLTHTFKQTS